MGLGLDRFCIERMGSLGVNEDLWMARVGSRGRRGVREGASLRPGFLGVSASH